MYEFMNISVMTHTREKSTVLTDAKYSIYGGSYSGQFSLTFTVKELYAHNYDNMHI